MHAVERNEHDAVGRIDAVEAEQHEHLNFACIAAEIAAARGLARVELGQRLGRDIVIGQQVAIDLREGRQISQLLLQTGQRLRKRSSRSRRPSASVAVWCRSLAESESKSSSVVILPVR